MEFQKVGKIHFCHQHQKKYESVRYFFTDSSKMPKVELKCGCQNYFCPHLSCDKSCFYSQKAKNHFNNYHRSMNEFETLSWTLFT
jgi:hypothetical protein